MSSYHIYQHILNFSEDGTVLKPTPRRRKFKKSVDGCLNCKKRRKKCDETKPECKNCIRRGIECRWPAHVNSKAQDDKLLDQLISIQEEDIRQEEAVSSEETLCYDAFVSVFLSSITPAHCHPLLSPMSILLPYAVTNSTVKEIFLACGATIMAYADDSFIQRAHIRYHNALNLLISDIQKSKDGCEDHLFISVQLLQTLCLRDKTLGLSATKSAAHISAAYEILKKRFAKELKISPLDRILTEHFVFNYPITLMMCHHGKLSAVPSPFSFYSQFGKSLETPLNDCSSDPWLDHPILGVGLKAHEISAKCTWMCRVKELPLSLEDLTICKRLLEEATENLQRLKSIPMYSLEKAQKQTLSFSKTVIYASLILLTKLCNNRARTEDVQKELRLLLDEVLYSKQLDDDYFQSIWAMFIAGSVCIDPGQRLFISERFRKVSSMLHSSLSEKVLRYLEMVWGEEEDKQVGLDFLFDTTMLDIVCS